MPGALEDGGLFCFVALHSLHYGALHKSVDALALALCVGLNCIFLAFWDHQPDAIICLCIVFVVACCACTSAHAWPSYIT